MVGVVVMTRLVVRRQPELVERERLAGAEDAHHHVLDAASGGQGGDAQLDVERAELLVDAALAAGTDWIEIGKPFIEFHGITGIGPLMERCSNSYVLVDLMIMAAPAKYLGALAERGVRNATVTALAPEVTVLDAIEQGQRLGVAITVDLFNVAHPKELAVRYAEAGADFLMVHYGVDQKRADTAGTPLRTLEQIVRAVQVPISYATYDLSEARSAIDAGASIIVQGEPLLSTTDPRRELGVFIKGLRDCAIH